MSRVDYNDIAYFSNLWKRMMSEEATFEELKQIEKFQKFQAKKTREFMTGSLD